MSIGIIVNPRKPEIKKQLQNLDSWIGENRAQAGFYLCGYDSKYLPEKLQNIEQKGEDWLYANCSLLITLGGDGTILRTVARLDSSETKILGVNLGGLGFLANTPPDRMLEHISEFLADNYEVDTRSMLRCKINGQESFSAFNDVIIDKAGFSRVIQIDTKVDGKHLNSYIADGLVVSTPSGSTGYSLSAGGPIVVPHTNAIVINPICPHSLTNRPVVIPDNYDIKIRVFTEHESFNIMRDGMLRGAYPSGTRLVIRKSKRTVSFVKMKSQNFFRTISRKLRWGEDFRDKKRWTYQKDDNTGTTGN